MGRKTTTKQESLALTDSIEQKMLSENESSPLQNKIGVYLKQCREDKNISLKDVSQKLCIRETFLRAIEESNYAILPEHVYTYGFIRSYAHFLGLNEEEILTNYRKETFENIPFLPYIFPAPVPQKSLPSFFNYGVGLLFIFLALFSWYYIKNYMISTPFDTSYSPQEAFEQEISAVPNEPQTISTPLETVSLDIQTEEENPLSASLTEPLLPSYIPEVVEPLELPPPQNIQIEALQRAWIQIRDTQGNIIFTKTLTPHEIYNVPTNDDALLTLTTGNAGGLKVSVGDSVLPPLGKKGEVLRNITLTPEKLLEVPFQAS